ncbi:hypothetical protein HMPREF1624_05615 [Sporothrix schenckii ATCC 58251]|uniref:Major facilitator superfamily (MFS) profile domain-containing protein n=1 Tax=Sporothrix schenckii (strain ATCC 58251 / de Perez 2211183) TaxID=1391915 RepID=U7PPA0_SPOS1|nr:hypothetical protein HMPREF1624_05615 [Sporothrix schenckii ATCC 58251]
MSDTVTSIELQTRTHDASFQGHDAHRSPDETVIPGLKPVDKGRDAWMVLTAGFVFDALFWGFPMCFGVFQDYYSSRPEFEADAANVTIIGTVAQALYYLGAPFSALLAKRFPKYRRQQIWLGWLMCILGLLAASFATSVTGLIGTQGVLYGFGFVILSYPIISMINEWWVSRKGMAFGLISASSGATGAVMPFIITSLLAKYGYRTTLQACAVAMTILTGPLIPLLKSRLPASDQAQLARTEWSFLQKPLFWVYGIAILTQGLGFFFPINFLPTYASSIGMSTTGGALLLSLLSIAQVLGQFAFGYLSDKNLPVSVLAGVCCTVAGAASFVLWGLSTSLAWLIPFSIIYGFFACGFGTMRVAMGRDVHGDPLATYAIYVFLQGVGNILVGPISAALTRKPVSMADYGCAKYAGIILLTGATSLLATAFIAGWHLYRIVEHRKTN